MHPRSPLVAGAQAGLVAGLAVAVLFFLGDLVRLAPLSTPAALSRAFIGPGATFDIPLLGSVVAMASFGARLLAFTALHLLAFALLGIGAVVLFERLRWPLNALTGAPYGLLACTLALYGSTTLAGSGVLEGTPDLRAVLVANLLAGAVMGGVAGALRRP